MEVEIQQDKDGITAEFADFLKAVDGVRSILVLDAAHLALDGFKAVSQIPDDYAFVFEQRRFSHHREKAGFFVGDHID